MIVFNLILKAAQKREAPECFWILFLCTAVMLAFAYARAPDPLEAWIGKLWNVRYLYMREYWVLAQVPQFYKYVV